LTLKEDSRQLEEVIVVGFGTQKKENLTGSVSQVSMDEVLGDRPVTSAAAALQGAMPGLTIGGGSGPGQSKSFNIRGTLSINGGSPLVLIDNVEGDINMLNPEDIESVTVLKDAASSAIYGARAAGGVVLVTTKRPKSGTNFNLNYNFNVQAYSSDTDAEVVLLRGSVKLKDKHEEELLLQPDELAVIMGSSIKEKKHVNASDYILWTKGLLKLDATPLSAVFKRLERYYGVKLAYSEEMESMKLYGSLDLQCSLEEILRRISLTAPVSFQKMDNKIEIHINNVYKNK
jgi:TonB-dependent SusC/RagA subfamily outer membrane receptor